VQDPIDTVVDDNFEFDAKELRMTFMAGDDIWAVKFGSPASFERFLQRYNKASFENRFGQEQTAASESKVGNSRPSKLRHSAACGRPVHGLGEYSQHLADLLPASPFCPQLLGDFSQTMNNFENDESRQHWVEDMDTDQPDLRVCALWGEGEVVNAAAYASELRLHICTRSSTVPSACCSWWRAEASQARRMAGRLCSCSWLRPMF
jgi:hypothetical protein